MTNSNISKENIKTLNLIQFVLEIVVIACYALGIIGGLFGLYYILMFLIIPATIANLVISILVDNKTMPYTITNVIMSVITIIPIIGFFTAIAGIIMSALSIVKTNKIWNKTKTKSEEEVSTDVDFKEKVEESDPKEVSEEEK